MRYLAYIGFMGGETETRSIHEESKLAGAILKQYTKLKAEYSPTQRDAPWGWQTAYYDITADPDNGLQQLLIKHQPLLPILANYSKSDSYICVMLVVQYDEGEDARGILLSSSTISLLAKFKADLVIDTDRVMTENTWLP
jgi:hypothetical protein